MACKYCKHESMAYSHYKDEQGRDACIKDGEQRGNPRTIGKLANALARMDDRHKWMSGPES